MEMILFAMAIGLIPAAIAHSKGDSFLTYWIFGTLLFIIALPAALLMKPNQKVLEARKLKEGMKKCPYCAEMIKTEAAICRYCGRP